jgi:hypothetical protein
MTFHGCFLPSVHSFGQAVSEEKICLFRNQPIRNNRTPQANIVSGWLISKKIFSSETE